MNPSEDHESPLYGVAAEFDSARDLFHAAEQMRDAGFRRFDVFSPFPIHGMDEAMGLKRSLLGKIIFLGGLTGFVSAVALQFIPSSFIYPLIVMGKPTNLFTVPAFFPIMFEEYYRPDLGIHGHLRDAYNERAAAAESPDARLGKVQTSQRRQVFLRDRKAGSHELLRAGGQGFPRIDRRAQHHQDSRELSTGPD